MSKNVRNGIIAFVVVLVASFTLGFIGIAGFQRTAMSMGVGLLVYYALQARSGTTKEIVASTADRSAALATLPPSDAALLFVRRPGILGKIVGINLALDGQIFAQLRGVRFTVLPIAPGTHTLVAASSATVAQNNPTTTTFDAVAGQRIFFDLSMKMGMMDNSLVLTQIHDANTFLASLASLPMIVATTSTTTTLSA